ncbi:MAG: glycosyltransferase involved in cell wall biosynthesis [Halioglobus sp.]|jgi:glycosyltransferase involved in cell wall biosynthesis
MTKLSVIVIAHNMAREIPRTLASLSQDYQIDCDDLSYEVLVVDNGSQDALDESLVCSFGPQFHYHYLTDPPPSPAFAMNYGAARATGDILCFIIDGAHILTPGVFKFALASFRAFNNAIVATRYFFLGPGDQNDSILHGYNTAKEDALLDKVGWPDDGYRLFEIGSPLQGNVPKVTWFNKMLESNCLFMKRESFEDIGGADERFDIAGGGFLNIDIYRQACELPDAQPVLLIGEGSFHQVHGGTTTNVTPQQRDARVIGYQEQYRELRGSELAPSTKDVYFMGHLPTLKSKIHMRKNRGTGEAISQNWKDTVRDK